MKQFDQLRIGLTVLATLSSDKRRKPPLPSN